MKTRRALMLFGIIIAVLAGTFCLLKFTGKETRDTENTENYIYKDIDKIIRRIEISKDGTVIEFRNQESVFVNPDGYLTDEVEVNRLVFCLKSLPYEKKLNGTPADYGISEDYIRCIAEDGTENLIFLGRFSENGDGRYVSYQNQLYKINLNNGEILNKGFDELRDKNLLTDIGEITDFAYYKNGSLFVRIQSDKLVHQVITEPILCGADTVRCTEIFDSICALKAKKYVDVSEEAAGLKNPIMQFVVADRNIRHELKIGTQIGEQNYASLDGGDPFVVDISDLQISDMTLLDFSDKYIFSINLGKVKHLTEMVDGRTFAFDIDAGHKDKEEDRFLLNGRRADQKDDSGNQYFRKHYLALITIEIEEIDTRIPDDSRLGEIAFAVSIITEDGNNIVYSFVDLDKDKYCVFRDTDYTGLIIKREELDKTDGVKQTLSDLCRAINE